MALKNNGWQDTAKKEGYRQSAYDPKKLINNDSNKTLKISESGKSVNLNGYKYTDDKDLRNSSKW